MSGKFLSQNLIRCNLRYNRVATIIRPRQCFMINDANRSLTTFYGLNPCPVTKHDTDLQVRSKKNLLRCLDQYNLVHSRGLAKKKKGGGKKVNNDLLILY